MAIVPLEQRSLETVSETDRNRINEILRTSGLIGSDDQIGSERDAELAGLKWPKIPNPVCKLGCNAAEAIAIAACGGLSGPAAGVCIVAAHAAADLCRSRC